MAAKMGLIVKANARNTDVSLLEKLAKGIDTLAARPGMDAATFKRLLKLQADTLARWYQTFDQSGDGVNTRFSGAASHAFYDQLTAFSAKVRQSKVPQIQAAPADAAPADAAPANAAE